MYFYIAIALFVTYALIVSYGYGFSSRYIRYSKRLFRSRFEKPSDWPYSASRSIWVCALTKTLRVLGVIIPAALAKIYFENTNNMTGVYWVFSIALVVYLIIIVSAKRFAEKSCDKKIKKLCDKEEINFPKLRGWWSLSYS